MKELNLAEIKKIKAGAISGALLSGIASLIEAVGSVIVGITSAATTAKISHSKMAEAHSGTVKDNKGMSFSWNDNSNNSSLIF